MKNVCLLAIAFLVVMTAVAYAEHPCAKTSCLGPSNEEILSRAIQSVKDGQFGAARCFVEGLITSFDDWATMKRDDFDPQFTSYLENASVEVMSAGDSTAIYRDQDFWIARGDDSTYAIFCSWPGDYSAMFILTRTSKPSISVSLNEWPRAYLAYKGASLEGLSSALRNDYKAFVADSLAKAYCSLGDSSAYFQYLSDRIDLPEDKLSLPFAPNGPHPGSMEFHVTFSQPTGYAATQFHHVGGTKFFVSNDWQGWRFFFFEGSRTLYAVPTTAAFEQPQSRR